MISFADILAPITPAQFFADYHGRRWLHVPGAGSPRGADKFAAVMTRAKLDSLVSTIGIWNAQSLQLARDSAMISAKDYCDPEGRPDSQKLQALLRDGASLVLNDIDLQAPGLSTVSALAQALEDTLEAKAQANLYSSPRQRQAFASHYDSHDVYAAHIEGEKLWRIYEGRAELPIEHPAYKSQSAEINDKAKGKVVAEVLMKPGDLLYLPRGQYHDAIAQTERTTHIAFGVVGVIGMDVVSALYARAVDDVTFRADLPRRHGQGPNTGRALFDERVAALGRRLAELAAAPDVIAALHNFQDEYRYRSKRPEMRYEPTARDFSVVAQGGRWALARAGKGVPIPPGLNEPVAWIVGRENFSENELTSAFPLLDGDTRGELLRSLLSMKVIAAI
ncbi:MAG TPA: cupin domain-containing protein [Alphaproteobacteria bacterium]|nr:cupin domain-containing protein [Alphaproteobacteria bacterium]